MKKLSSFAVGAASKANSLAVEAAAKANLAIENSKLNLKIGNEEKKIDTFTVSIGELILDKLDGGETFDDEIMALYSSIQASRETITTPGLPLRPTIVRPSPPISAPLAALRWRRMPSTVVPAVPKWSSQRQRR